MKMQIRLLTVMSGLIFVVGCRSEAGKDRNRETSGNYTDKYVSVSPTQKGAGNNYKWINVTNDAAYAPRDGAGAVVYNGKMWLLGGWMPVDRKKFPDVQNCNNEVWSSINGAEWNLEKPNTFIGPNFDSTSDWQGRHTAGYVVYNNKIWIIGGDLNTGHYQNDIWCSTDGKKWTCINRNVPWGPRVLFYTVVFNNKIWIMGGQTIPQYDNDSSAGEKFFRDIWCTTDGLDWRQVMPKEPYWPARGMIGGSVVFNGRMWILGGGTYETPNHPLRQSYNDVWSSADGVNWQCHLHSAPWKPRHYHDVAVFDNKMWVLEGWRTDNGNQNDVWYSSDGTQWHELPNTPWTPRHAANIFVYDNALWVVAGNNLEKDVWKLARMP